MPDVYWVRPPSGAAVPYEDWKEDAACDGLPVHLFELDDDTEPRLQGEAIAEGLKVCASCPVRQACRTNSNEEDRYWTTRGGQPPEGLFRDSKMPKFERSSDVKIGKPITMKPRKPQEKCKRGHEDWYVKADGKRRCRSCQRGKW